MQFVNCSTGQNPSGSSMFLERRKQLYAIFQKHDILIIEDDPYCKPTLICVANIKISCKWNRTREKPMFR
jgi:hypothetical protein